MEFGEIFTNALKYPISDYAKLLILGVVLLISSVPAILAMFGFYNSTFTAVWSIISIIIGILTSGYGLSVKRESISLNDEIPAFDWVNNIIDGVKSFIVTFVYFIVPTVVVSFLGFISLGSAISTLPKSSIAAISNATTTNAVLNAIPPQTWTALGSGFSIVAVIAIILFVIFGLFETVAICRLAKYGTFGEAFAFGEVYNDIKQIGVLKLIVFYIILACISALISLVLGFIGLIPFVGIIIVALVGQSFVLLFTNRAIGLLYSDVE